VIENSLPEPGARASDQNARALSSTDQLAASIETEIERIREARPQLSSRLDRASNLLLLQLASPPRQRPVKVRIAADGHRRFEVASATRSGVVYSVDPATYSCSCPDTLRRGIGCKHSIACWCLKRAADRRAQRKEGCPLCINGWVHLSEQLIDSHTGEVVEATSVVRCRRCTPVAPGCLSDEELRSWMSSVRWKYAASMPRHPHEYHLKRWGDPETFETVVKSIWSAGYDRRYLRRPWRSLDVGEHYLWVCTMPQSGMAPPISKTILINRALQVQERLV
jgi:hypothetical protein